MLRRLLVPSVPCLLGLLAFTAVCLEPAPIRLLSWDSLLHVALGEHMLRQGARVETDVTSWAVDRPYIDHEWLPQLILGAFRLALGVEGLVVFSALAVGATFWLLAAWMGARGIGPPVTAALLLGLYLALGPFLFARPLLWSWFLAVLWTLLLDRLSRGELDPVRWLAFSLPLMLLWANVHAGFFLGFLVLGIFGLAQLWRIGAAAAGHRRAPSRLLLWMVAGGNLCLLASAINPWGFRLHAHFLVYLANSRLITAIGEWQAPAFHDNRLFFSLAFLGFSFFVWLAAPRRLTAPDLLLVTVLLLSALKAGRNLPFLMLLTLPIVAAQLDGMVAELAASSSLFAAPAQRLLALSRWTAAGELRRGGALTAAAVVAVGVLAVGGWKVRPVDLEDKFPVAAARFIGEHPELFRGRMFNSYDWGGYLGWALAPSHRVFINGLQDHYGERHYLEYREVVGLRPLWQRILDRRGVEWVIAARTTSLTTMLDSQPGWRRVYRDPAAEIYVRRELPATVAPGARALRAPLSEPR